MAFTTCGTTVSSYPMMPGNSVSPRCSLQIRLPRNSSFTFFAAMRSSEKLLLRKKPSVLGNSPVVWIMNRPGLYGDCNRLGREKGIDVDSRGPWGLLLPTKLFTAETQRRREIYYKRV